jgi:two-component system nitrogen regulation response regulator NtrX
MALRGPRVLIVDDEAAIRQTLAGVLSDEGYTCNAVPDGDSCLKELARESYEAVLLDIWMPGADGLQVLEQIQALPPADRPVVIMISGHGNIETAVKATKLGAYDFIEKPLTIEKVSLGLKNALEQRRMQLELTRLREDADVPEIIGSSVPIKALRQQLKLMAATNGRVLPRGGVPPDADPESRSRR